MNTDTKQKKKSGGSLTCSVAAAIDIETFVEGTVKSGREMDAKGSVAEKRGTVGREEGDRRKRRAITRQFNFQDARVRVKKRLLMHSFHPT